MDVGESIMWILRIAATLLITGVMVAFIFLMVPPVEAPMQHAELLGARILHDGGFSERPARIDTRLFTNDTSRAYYQAPQGALHENLGGRAWITAMDGTLLHKSIVYHEAGYNKLKPFALTGIGSVQTLQWSMPVILAGRGGAPDTQAILHVEVLYVDQE